MRWTDALVREALGLASVLTPASYSQISTDTRTIGTDGLFVALKGERFDGHDHLVAARDAGATGAVVRTGTAEVEGLRLYPVDDTLEAYGRLALLRRRRVVSELPPGLQHPRQPPGGT